MKELNVIREHGVAYDREEHEEGIISIAAPILVSNGRLIGAISIATSTQRRSLAELDEFQPVLLDTAKTRSEKRPCIGNSRHELGKERQMSGVILENAVKRFGDVQVIHGVDLGNRGR